jgi:hypothetical protein
MARLVGAIRRLRAEGCEWHGGFAKLPHQRCRYQTSDL